MKIKETLDKAYSNIPKEVGFGVSLFDNIEFRGVKYYFWRIVRFFTR
jgi:hypothetical protein